jgi:hypothetical protein
MTERIAIAGVSERDVDLLLLEEFQSSSDFQGWFVREAFGPDVDFGQCTGARRSITNSTGESDLEIFFSNSKVEKTRLLIENKVNAGFQPLQAERYKERGVGYVSTAQCNSFRTVIVAPARYFGESASLKGFDSRVSYEQILRWFEEAVQLGARRLYKVALLRSAIDKGTLGYQPEEDKPTTGFWKAYWHFALDRAPELEMSEPGAKPSRSSFVHFRPRTLPRSVDIVHKFAFGHVDLHLRGMGKRLNEVRVAARPYLSPDMTVSAAAKSAAIRIKVPKLSVTTPFEAQTSEAERALDAAKLLHAWFIDSKVFATWLVAAQQSVAGDMPQAPPA